MTRISFWNVQRLGATTDAARQSVLLTLAKNTATDLNLYCELTTLCTIPIAQNLTYRKENASQLCYGAVDVKGVHVKLTTKTPLATNGYRNAGFKGGNDFSQLAVRALAYAGKIGGAHVFTIHANSSNKAIKVMSFIASSLNAEFAQTPWIAVGDFNVEPQVLAGAPVGIKVGDLIRKSGLPTHFTASTGVTSEIDYALTNIPNPEGYNTRRQRLGRLFGSRADLSRLLIKRRRP